ncbi:MAG: hypothetical protein HYW02_08570 [Deltaproteobacteria bacterium]|nr:hypothetical protein [Deltaproteobacteria bacterium]
MTPFDPAITLSPESDPVDWVHAFARYFGLTYDREDEKIEMGVYDLQDPLNQDEKETLQCLLSEEVAPHLNPNLTEEERPRIESLTVGCDDDPETLGSIQEAVDQISWGGEIVVCRGGYFESLNIHGGSFTLAANISRPGTIDPVFINPIEGERALAISAGANVTVGNIGFAHGEADEGGVVRVQDSQLHLYDSQIGGGTAVRGGGLACFNSLCSLERREQAMFISVCEASEKGAAVFLSHSLFTTYETLMDEDLVEGGKGAGIYAERGSVIEGVNTHLFNMRAGRGTALYLEDSVAFLRGDSSISATFAMEESSGAVELVSGDGESTLMIEPPFSWNQFGTSRGRSIRNNPADVVIRGGGTYSGLSNNQVLFCSTESGVCE